MTVNNKTLLTLFWDSYHYYTYRLLKTQLELVLADGGAAVVNGSNSLIYKEEKHAFCGTLGQYLA